MKRWYSISSKLYSVRLLLGLLSIILLVSHDFIPERRLTLFPMENVDLALFSDSDVDQGLSEASWIDKKQQRFRCTYKKQPSFRFCGLTLKFFKDDDQKPVDRTTFAKFKTLDLSRYHSFKYDLNIESDVSRLRVFFRAARDELKNIRNSNSSTYIYAFIDKEELNKPVTIKKEHFNVALWWVELFNVNREDSQPKFDRIIEIAVGLPSDSPLGDHDITINNIEAIGSWISKEVLYFIIVLMWISLLVVEGVTRYSRMYKNLNNRKRQLDELETGYKKLKSKLQKDSLTQVLNRRGLETFVEKLKKSQCTKGVGLLVIDLDYFKQINDTYGHTAGDHILKKFTAVISNTIREDDVLARWGGEEFVILTSKNDLQNLQKLDSRLRAVIKGVQFSPQETDIKLNVTYSCGATIWPLENEFNDSFNRADKALYEAKSSGRDKTVFIDIEAMTE